MFTGGLGLAAMEKMQEGAGSHEAEGARICRPELAEMLMASSLCPVSRGSGLPREVGRRREA